MMLKKLATRPARPAQFSKLASFAFPAWESASIKGASEIPAACAPITPATKSRTPNPLHAKIARDAIRARGISRFGCVASSAARGTPSTPRKNQIPKGKLAIRPEMPNGSKGLEATEPSTGISNKLDASKAGREPATNAISAVRAIAVMTNISFRASPTPTIWIPAKSAYTHTIITIAGTEEKALEALM